MLITCGVETRGATDYKGACFVVFARGLTKRGLRVARDYALDEQANAEHAAKFALEAMGHKIKGVDVAIELPHKVGTWAVRVRVAP